ncbi:MAG: SPOR domain-containing protein [Phycisphaerales bacterium]
MARPFPLTAPTLSAAALLLAATLLAPGCAPRAANRPAEKLTSVQLFETGQYSAAYEQSTQEAQKLTGTPRAEASLIAGLSAQALNKNAEAVRWLKPLADGTDPVLVGKSNAALGLIAQERGEHEAAARHLLIAGEKLQGDEAARSSMYAGDSLNALGKHDDAKAAYTRAQQQVANDSGLRIMIGDRLRGVVPGKVAGTASPGSGASPQVLTVQVGAWSNPTTAKRQAEKLTDKSQVRIVNIIKNGQRLYAVRVGHFSSREAAEQVRKVIGGSAVVTVASGE